MQLYHLGSNRYAAQLTGEGARLFGGRWNKKGDACLYASGTQSLCILEYLANVSLDEMPPDLAMTTYSLPDDLCTIISVEDLPEDWFAVPAPVSCKNFGSALLTNRHCVCFAVPSAIVHAEQNFVLNPAATEFRQLRIISTEMFKIDHRIKK